MQPAPLRLASPKLLLALAKCGHPGNLGCGERHFRCLAKYLDRLGHRRKPSFLQRRPIPIRGLQESQCRLRGDGLIDGSHAWCDRSPRSHRREVRSHRLRERHFVRALPGWELPMKHVPRPPGPEPAAPSQKEHDPGERDGRGNEPEIPRQADADDAHHDRQQGDRREGHAISRGDLAEREDDAESHEGKRETLRPRRAKRIQRQAHCDKEEDKEQRLHRPATVEPSRSLMWAPSETRGRVSRRARSPWPLVDRYGIHVLARLPPRITILDCIRAYIVPVSRPRPTIARINHQ